jgi:hypothetical protein
MNYPMQPIIQHLFQAASLEDVSRQRLESFVAEYPSFGIGHYLLSRKLQAEGADSYMEETQKTNLYFTNPFWLQLLLESPQDGGVRVSGTPVRPRPETIASPLEHETVTPAIESETHTPSAKPETHTSSAEPEIATSSVEPEIIASIAEPELPKPGIVASSIEPVKDTMDNVVEESLFAGPETDLSTPEPTTVTAGPETTTVEPETATSEPERATTYTEDEPSPQSMVSLAEAVAAAEEPSAAELLLRSIEQAKGLRESLQKMNEDFSAGKSLPAAEEQMAQPITQEQTQQPIKDEEAPFVLDEDVMPVAEIQSAPPTHSPALHTAPESASGEALETAKPLQTPSEPAMTEAPQPSAIATTLAAASATLSTPVPAAEQTFVFEPYHTIDYFASQGIKLTLEENPSDQLGKQLKSFTDWLKVMRRLPQKEREIIPDRAAEQTVQTIAAHSVVGREIVTETMAEVLAKQGMPERARAVYEKLSLLNPDKRAYFATKIEQLNSH